MRRWPTTLRAQFVAVVGAAVILSNLAVVVILEVGREGELRGARLAAAVDRIGGLFDYISNIPEEQRGAAVRALSGNFFHYEVSDTPQFDNAAASDEERRIGREIGRASCRER